MTAPIASIIVPVHNRPRQIIACLESLAASDYDPFEIIVVDDASTDNTVAHVEQFCQSHPDLSIRIIQNPTNLGAAGARDAGIDAAKGDYILFFDSDCTADRNWLPEMVKPMASEEADAVTGKVLEVPARNLAELWHDGSSRVDRRMPTFMESSMGLRGDLAKAYRFDVALMYGGEGDDLARRMSLDGHRVVHVDVAVSHHDHPMTLAHCLRRGYQLGMGSTRYWYKHDMYVGRDLLPLAAALMTLPLGLLGLWWLMIPGMLLALQLAALAYNEIVIKRKTLWQTVQVYPIAVLFYLARSVAVPVVWYRLLIGKENAIRESKRRLRQQRTRRSSLGSSVNPRERSHQTLCDVRVTVCVITYLRPVGLRRLLESLNHLTFLGDSPRIEIVVVDNDLQGSARSVCEAARAVSKWPIRYEIEPQRGISFARNRAVAMALPNSDWLALIDDDEVAPSQWLDELLRVEQTYGADVVTGPVTPYFHEPAPQWIVQGRFFESRRYVTGRQLDVAYTHNVMVRSAVFQAMEECFDPQFGLTGGEDGEFFGRVNRDGYKIIWADDAGVQEWIPPSRLLLSWLLMRYCRTGNSLTSTSLKHHPGWFTHLLAVAKAAVWCAVGVLMVPLGVLLGRQVAVQGMCYVAYAVGTLMGLFGRRVEEYRTVHGT